VLFGRLQRHVAVLVVTQLAASLADEGGAPLLLVKGGSSLELRRGISDSRTSKDLDTVARQDIESVHEHLADAGELGWEGFSAIFTRPEEIDVPGLLVKPRRFLAKLSYRGKPFASVPIEVSTIEAGNSDQFDNLTSEALGLVGVSADVTVPCMTLPWQIAQKLHAATAVLVAPKTNDRAHDLVDLQLLEALQGEIDLAETRCACVAVFVARAQHLWPPQSPHCRTGPQFTRARWKDSATLSWRRRWRRQSSECSDSSIESTRRENADQHAVGAIAFRDQEGNDK
jgi:hypothetical protein